MNYLNDFKPFGAVPNDRQMQWYKRGKTAFIHYGMNTFTNREWGDGTEREETFCPTNVDCKQWVSELYKNGFTVAILTAKHHGGFCLWPSKYTEHSIKNSPYKNGKGDIVREFVDACKEVGMKPGIYLSPWDRNFAEWGTEAYNDYYVNQLTELMTEYGDIYECWWDGAGSTEANYDWARWANTVRKYQKNCVIFGSLGAAPYVDVHWVGNELGRAGDPCWGTIDEDSVFREDAREMNKGKFGGDRFIPAEADMSIRPGWFYHEEQNEVVKTPVKLVDYWFTSVGKNTGILLNLPPTKDGVLHEIDCKNIAKWNEYLDEIFETNLLCGATVNASDCIKDYKIENLLDEDYDKIYATNDKNAIITYEFPEEKAFNCFKLQEVIELGHRIKSFRLEAKIDGEWKEILNKECIGFCRADKFERITASAVRLTLDAVAEPLLRFFGVYNAPDHTIREEFETSGKAIDLTTLPTLRFIKIKDGYEVELGGIYEFNTIICDATDCFAIEIFAFDGSQYKSIFYNQNGSEHELCTFKTVEGSYKFKILFYEATCDKDRKIQILKV